MNPLRHSLLTDENVDGEVVAGMRARGCLVETAADAMLLGTPDQDLLRHALTHHQVVITHDLGFARAWTGDGGGFVGIIYLRLGHITAAFTLESIDAILSADLSPDPPFVLVATHGEHNVRLRLRSAPPW